MSAKAKRDAFYPERIEGGRFVTRAVNQLMRQYEGKQVEVCIREKRYYTSNPQRGYYWGVVVFLIGERMRSDGVTGPYGGPITDQEVHELLAAKFLRVSVCVNPETGECEDYVKSTSRLTVREMGEYLERVIAWAAETFVREVPCDDGSVEVRPFEIPEPGTQLTFV